MRKVMDIINVDDFAPHELGARRSRHRVPFRTPSAGRMKFEFRARARCEVSK